MGVSKLKVLDLFSGIGGFSLGLEQTGHFETAAFCEADKKARQVLNKRWPDVPVFDDVRKLKATDVGAIDLICGGFPCQDISQAGKGRGLSGERSGLWFEMLRLIREIKPSWVIVENVSVLRNRGLDQILSGLYEVGYDAEWHCITASSVGAPHRRDRIWIVAYPQPPGLSLPESQALLRAWGRDQGGTAPECNRWPAEPAFCRMAYGVPGRVDRLKQLGNSVVPEIPRRIGQAIINHINS